MRSIQRFCGAVVCSPALRPVLRVALHLSLSIGLVSLSLGLVAVLPFFGVDAAAETKILSHSDGKLSLTVRDRAVEKQKGLELIIKSSSIVGTSVFSLADPPRIVIDLQGAQARGSRVFTLSNDPTISAMRVGVHKDKVRIVIDVKTDIIPDYSWSERKGSAVLSMKRTPRRGGTAPAASRTETKPADNSASTAPVAKRSDADIPQPVRKIPTPKALIARRIAADEVEEPAAAPTSTPRPAQPTATIAPAPPAPKPTPPSSAGAGAGAGAGESVAGQSVRAISFDYDGNVPVVKIKLKKRPQFELVKKEENTYRISIADAPLGDPGLALVQFPPHDFFGFTMVKSEARGSGTDILIGVERGVRISASPVDTEIWVRVSAGL